MTKNDEEMIAWLRRQSLFGDTTASEIADRFEVLVADVAQSALSAENIGDWNTAEVAIARATMTEFKWTWLPIAEAFDANGKIIPELCNGESVLLYWPDYDYSGGDTERYGVQPARAIGSWKYNRRIEKWYFSDNDEMDDYGLAEKGPSHFAWLPELPEPPSA